MLSNDPCDQLFRFRAGNQDSFTDGEGPAVKFDTADDVLYGASFLYVPDYFSHAYFRAFRARSIRLDHDIGEPHFEQFVTEQGRGGTRRSHCLRGTAATACCSALMTGSCIWRCTGQITARMSAPACCR